LREPLGGSDASAPSIIRCLHRRQRGAPLVTGNTLVVKPADQTPLTSLRIAELWGGVFPPGVFNVVTGGGRRGRRACRASKVAKIGFIRSKTPAAP
jgi:acyl-CoA reductase-like NAD-dependent aldehyde dehydrogenase